MGIEVGTTLEEVYEIRGQLGAGGMGRVMLARDLRLERDVAVKVMHAQMHEQERFHKRFLTEARAMARVRHINVVSVYSFGEAHGEPYFVMEYVPGPTLAAWSQAQWASRPIPYERVFALLEQMIRGLDAIHAADVVHLDLKPTNVILGPRDRVAVTDFGLSCLLDTADAGAGYGSPAFMAPELVTNGPGAQSTHADDYSFTVIAYELLSGRRPFSGPPRQLMSKKVLKPAPPPSKHRPELPAGFDEVILAGLEREPEARSSRHEVLEGLRQALSAPTSTPGQGVSILIADDDADLRELAQACIEEAFPQARVRCAQDGAEAQRMLDEEPATLALIDLQMPNLNGVELVASLRAEPHTQNTRVVVMTAVGGAADWRVLDRLGAEAFLLKPFQPGDLTDTLQSVLGFGHE